MPYNFRERFNELGLGAFWPSWPPQMPFVDFHKMNLDWILEAMRAVLDQMKYYFIDGGSKETIEEVMEEHPEWWPRVMDGAITYVKLSGSIRAFTTPEAFGAVGDGETDDTEAWQTAVDVGVPVIALHDIYKCGQINVTKNICIDCNNANFICTDSTLFYCTGEETQTIPGINYTANQTDYSVGAPSYNGVVFVEGTNNFMPTRTYYKGGFMATCTDGIIDQVYPINATDVTLHFIEPITLNLRNINNIEHINHTSPNSIRIKYGLNCGVEGINGDFNSYTVICLEKCLNCIVRESKINNSFGTVGTNSYIVAFNDSSLCKVVDVIFSNKYWHCVTTGGEYLAFGNIVDQSELYSLSSLAFSDHDNGLYTVLKNTCSDGALINGGGKIKDCTITPINNVSSIIDISACPLENCAHYVIENVEFITGDTFNSSNGVNISAFAEQVTGITKYVNDVTIKNCKSRGNSLIAVQINCASSEELTLQNVTIEKTPFVGYLGVTQNEINIDNYNLTLKHVKIPGKDFSQGPTVNFGKVYLYDCWLDSIRGNYDSIYFDNLKVDKQINDTLASVTGELIGGIVYGYFRNSFLYSIPLVSISQMTINNSYTANDITNASDGNKYYWWYGSNGSITATKITL